MAQVRDAFVLPPAGLLEELLEQAEVLVSLVPAAVRRDSECRMLLLGEKDFRHLAGQVHAKRIAAGRRAAAAIVEIAADETGETVFVAAAGGLPNVGRTEVALVGIWVADVLNDREFALLGEPVEAATGWVEAEVVVEPEDLVPRHGKAGPQVVVTVVRVGHDGVEPVVATGELDEKEDRQVRSRRRHAGAGGSDEEGRRVARKGEQTEPPGAELEEFAPGRGQEVKRVFHGGGRRLRVNKADTPGFRGP